MKDLKSLLKTIPYPLALLTARRGDEINGMPVSWLTQVSSMPPMIQVAVKTVRYTHDMILDTGRFALVFLSEDQKNVIPGFKTGGEDRSKKFEGFAVSQSSAGLPVLDDAVGWLDCRVVSMTRPGDHTLFVAEITDAKLVNEGEPLTCAHFGKDYHYGIS